MSERAWNLGSTLESEISSALDRNYLREEIRNYAQHTSPLSKEVLIKQCYNQGINFRFEMDQIEAEMDSKKTQDNGRRGEDLRTEFKKELEEYTSGKSDLSRDEFNEKYKALGIKINMTFKRTDVKKVASNEKARDVQSTQSELKSNYREIESPTQQLEDNKSKD